MADDERIASAGDRALEKKEIAVTDSDDGNGAPSYQVVRHVQDADEAMKAFEGQEGEVLVLDEETNRKLLWKIDRTIMPVSGETGNIN